MPPEIAADKELWKYWGQRYRLFSRFDEGIRMDRGMMGMLPFNYMCPLGKIHIKFIYLFMYFPSLF